jgi:histidinol phosphatase-like enzyme
MINYRPTSLLTSFSKALENITCGRLLHHINTNNILVNEQSGFQTKSSTEKAFFKLLNEMLNALNNKFIIEGIF